jgi:SulP family sulfate permease
MNSDQPSEEQNTRISASRSRPADILRNLMIGLAVSVVALNLGAALGILSERGAAAGMLSAGVIAFLTSWLGGTRIQGSGTTAPMSAVTALVVAFAYEKLPEAVPGISPDHFVNIVLLLTALIVMVAGGMRLGGFIAYVPRLVVSGFMCGIAILIWLLQIDSLFGINRAPYEGPVAVNIIIALSALALAFAAPAFLSRIMPKYAPFIPGTLVSLVIVSVMANLSGANIGYLDIGQSTISLQGAADFMAAQIPAYIDLTIILLALPFAFKLAALCYIDTLLTSLIVDKMRGTTTRRNKELIAQGTACGAVALIGGIPGAQSTVPSVLTVREGATMRLAGMSAGIFALLGLALFSGLMSFIPQAVFAGILIKVGCDVFDYKPILGYLRTLRKSRNGIKSRVLAHKEMIFYGGTAITTAFFDLIAAVALFTLLFHTANKYLLRRKICDFVPG